MRERGYLSPFPSLGGGEVRLVMGGDRVNFGFEAWAPDKADDMLKPHNLPPLQITPPRIKHADCHGNLAHSLQFTPFMKPCTGFLWASQKQLTK